MAGRKSVRNRNRADSKNESQSCHRPFITISPNGELRQRLIETAIDVKENIPAEPAPSRRVTRSSQNANALFTGMRSDSADSRKRRSVQSGPPAKRPSVEKIESSCSDDEDANVGSETSESVASSSSRSNSSSIASRTRGKPLPVMEEEDEVFDSSSDQSKMKACSSKSFESEAYDDEESDQVFEDEEEESDEEYSDNMNRPLQNIHFDIMKRHMNEVTVIQPPSSMKATKCEGIGSPEKVWSLMVSRDDLARASKCLLNCHPGMSVGMRYVLLDWMMEVCETENLHRETFHLSVDYVDRFLEAAPCPVDQDSFQLVGTAALFVAAKYEEIYPPKCIDFANLTDGAFDVDSIRKMEVTLVDSLNWTLGPITCIQWISTYLQMLGQKLPHGGDEHLFDSNYFVPELMREDFIHMAKILDYLLFEIDSLAFTYRTISAAVLFACYEPRDAVENVTGFVYEQLVPVIEYVEPVVHAFEKLRQAGDPFPVNDKIQSDDIHNVQTYFKYQDYKQIVDEERRRNSRLRHGSRSSSNIHQFPTL